MPKRTDAIGWSELSSKIVEYQARQQAQADILSQAHEGAGCKMQITFGGLRCHKVTLCGDYCPRHSALIEAVGLSWAERDECERTADESECKGNERYGYA